MNVTPSHFTVAEYCNQMLSNDIVVNRDYQRTDGVWPIAARSYLIETILLGYPIPKLSLYQKTDIKSKKALKEIVDGQQRSQAILNFFQNTFRLTGKGEFSGSVLEDLEPQVQQSFLEYVLSVDVFVGATDPEIRQVFRRMNSYTVPLNPQEKRHATYQGEFKWFIASLSDQYSQLLKDVGTLTERNLSRMDDASLLSEVVYAWVDGLISASEPKLDDLYKRFDRAFTRAGEMQRRFDFAFEKVLGWPDIHNGPLVKRYNLYSLLVVLGHLQDPVPALQPFAGRPPALDQKEALDKLSVMMRSLRDRPEYPLLSTFQEACAQATNRIGQRQERFRWFYRALTIGDLYEAD